MGGGKPNPTSVALMSDSIRNWPDEPERLGKLTLFAILTEVANTLLILAPIFFLGEGYAACYLDESLLNTRD
jgi:hypothetical protein